MNANNNTEVLQLFVVLASLIFGPSMAHLMGPYLLIAFAAATGAAWSLGRREAKGKVAAVFYFIRVVFTAILLTVALAKIAAGFVPQVQPEWLIAPVALIIGLIGDDWFNLWLWVKEILDRKFGG